MNNAEYWQKRAEQDVLKVEKEIDKINDDLKVAFTTATQKLINEIYKFYSLYDLTDYSNMYKILSADEAKELRDKARKVYKTAYSGELKTMANTLKSSYRIQRIKALLFTLIADIEELYQLQEDDYNEDLPSIYKSMYYKKIYDMQVGTSLGYDVDRLEDGKVKQAVSQSWLGNNYSKRIWNNRYKLATVLQQEVPQAIIQGQNPKQLAKTIQKRMNTSYFNAERLARTEYLHVLNEANYKAMNGSGLFKKYQYMATLDYRTSQICRDMDGKVFDMSKKQTGVNYPPLHPNCRSTTAPYFKDLQGTRIAKTKEGTYYEIDRNITYREWEKMQKLEENNK